jgi:N-methylhydantoinase B
MSIRLDENLLLDTANGTQHLTCAHCGHAIGPLGENFYANLPFYEGSPTEAGPQVWKDASVYIDKSVVFRQYYCPSCYTALRTEVVPTDHPLDLDKQISVGQ